MKKIIEKYHFEGEGYDPFLIRDNWQVAQLNYSPGQGLDDIEKIDIHFQTDEAFILTAGEAWLIAAEKNEDNLSFEIIEMKKGIVYNIPECVWHNIALSEKAQVIIVENKNTHLGDYEFYHLSDSQRKDLYRQLNSY